MVKIISIILFFTTLSLQAKECVVISGAKEDHNGAFKDAEFYKSDTQFNGWKCKIFDSWFLADAYLTKKNLKKGEQLLIVQGAHGSPGGGAQNNAGAIDGEQIYNFLEKYSAKYKTAAFIDSCYSGDLIRRKLKADLIKEEKSKMANLCIVTNSYFNQYSYGTSRVISIDSLKSSSGKSIIDYVSDKGDFLITSSPWSTLGISQYLSLKDVKDASYLLKQLNNQLYQADCGQSEASQLANLCQSSKMDAELLKDTVNYVEESEAIKSQFSTQAKAIDEFIAQIKLPAEHTDSLEYYKIACLQDFRSQLNFYNSGAYVSTNDPIDYLDFVVKSLKQKGRSCALFLEKKQSQTPIMSNNAGGIGGYVGSGGFGIPPMSNFIDFEIDIIAANQLFTSFLKLKEFKWKLEDRIGKVGRNLSPKDLAQALNGEKRECSSMGEADLKQFVNYIIGEANFNQGQIELAKPGRSNNNFSPNLIMKALGNLTIRNQKEHPHDVIRRNACRNFKL